MKSLGRGPGDWALLLHSAQSGRLLGHLSLVHPEAHLRVPSTEQREDTGM